MFHEIYFPEGKEEVESEGNEMSARKSIKRVCDIQRRHKNQFMEMFSQNRTDLKRHSTARAWKCNE